MAERGGQIFGCFCSNYKVNPILGEEGPLHKNDRIKSKNTIKINKFNFGLGQQISLETT